MKYYVYILTNYTNTVLYVGVTNNLERRIFEHKLKPDSQSFTAKYRLHKLIWFAEFNDVKEALAIEKKLKGWKRIKKLNLIKQNNPYFQDMFTSS